MSSNTHAELERALAFLNAASWKGSRPGLSRIRELMRRLGNPERGLRFVHVVGTNGKGSTCAMLASVLRAAGYRTGLFTSPYLVDFRERMQVDGALIPPDELAALADEIQPLAEAMADVPTEFERITAVALCWFARRGCDLVVLEAGMGGEFDATNVIADKELAVVTNVGLDHVEYLGGTVEQIARTKAGILTPGCDCVAYPSAPNVLSVLAERCMARGASLTVADPARLRCERDGLDGQRLTDGARSFTLPLLGAHQRANAAVALTAVDALRRRGWAIPDEAVCRGMERVVWPGRLQLVRREPPFLLDGGHNAQCIDALCRALDAYLPGKQLTVLCGVLADKDWPDMFRRLAPYAARFCCVTPPENPRALPAEKLAAHLAQYGKPVAVFDSPRAALERVLSATEPAVACGSLYLIGALLKILQEETK